MVIEQAEGCLPEKIGIEPLLSVWVLQGLLPVDGGEFEDAANGPTGQKAEEVAEIAPGLDLVELAAGEQGDESGIDFACFVASNEKPIFALMQISP